MEYRIYTDDGELYHWGIKGMRWGVRRFQNKDGSLTAAGKKRLKAESDAIKEEERILKNRKSVKAKLDKLAARRKAIEDDKKDLDSDSYTKPKIKKSESTSSQTSKKKTASEMTDAELDAAIVRARKEDEYRRLRPEPVNEKHPLMKKMLNDVIMPAATNVGKKALENMMSKVVEKVTGDKVDPNSLEGLKRTFDRLDYQHKIDKLRNPDKYLSEEDKTKRQNREFEAELREAQREGYQSVVERAKKRRDAKTEEDARVANENARSANEAKSREYYNSTYSKKGGESFETSPNKNSTYSNGKSYLNSTKNDSVSGLITDSNVSKGELVVRRSGSTPLATYDVNGNYIGFWSGIRGDSDVII